MINSFIKSILSVLIFNLFITYPSSYTFGQVKGEPAKSFNPDTNFIFQSPRPLINSNPNSNSPRRAWGIDLIFSNSGFGVGTFYQYYIAHDLFSFASLYISGARNTDETEWVDQYTGETIIIDKINRLYMFPLTLGLQQYLFTDVISESMKLFAQGGLGPTFILSTPYDHEFFSAFSFAKFYTRFGTFIGVGADVGSGTSLLTINARYYYIPFGGNGLESIRNSPIKDFGGLFLSLSFGARF
ncbi:MAG: hypothetical protein EPN82_05365 [Bacteroidetes bacterium]|nr:MAG: hypothetical protein EPN82_05365 [Bacteroidota bacterium]